MIQIKVVRQQRESVVYQNIVILDCYRKIWIKCESRIRLLGWFLRSDGLTMSGQKRL